MTDDTQAACERVRALATNLSKYGQTQHSTDLRTLLATVDAGREDVRRMRETMDNTASALNNLSDTDGAYLGGWGALMNALSHRLSDAARPLTETTDAE